MENYDKSSWDLGAQHLAWKAVSADRDRLAAENARLREAVRLGFGLIEGCQADLLAYLPPDSGISAHDVVSTLLGRLDGPQWRDAAAARSLTEAQP